MVIKLFDNLNNEFGSIQVVPTYVKYNLKYDYEKQGFFGYFELIKGQQDMITILKLLKHSTNQDFSHFTVSNEDGTDLYSISMLFQKNEIINMDNGELYIKMDIEINSENMDTYIEFLNSHNITI